MSQIKASLFIVTVAAAFTLNGCGDANNKAVFTPESGGHPANWKIGHTTAGKTNLESCFECHGEELDGGIVKVSCTSCHLGSPEQKHPLQWGSYAYARHASYVENNGTTSCANIACHGTNLAGVIGSGPSCTSCHLGGNTQKHPASWNTAVSSHPEYVNTNGSSSCRTDVCHGTTGKGVFLSGPACDSCHAMPTK